MGALSGRTALVTGGSRGQGEAEARLFVEEGANVVITDVLDAEGEALAAELGEAARYLHLDVTSEEEWDAAVAFAQEQFGGLDVLVNNAGVLVLGGLLETSAETFRQLVEVNQTGVFLGMRAAARVMGRGGSIVNTSSVDGLRGQAGLIAYGATKYAVIGMTKTASDDLAPQGIRVNVLCPGVITTPMLEAPEFVEAGVLEMVVPKIPLGRAGSAEEIARAALFLASEQSSFCSGSELVADGGMIAGI
jgi:3alpha(or 20beta)-hydroxysteroid dehydrogenase